MPQRNGGPNNGVPHQRGNGTGDSSSYNNRSSGGGYRGGPSQAGSNNGSRGGAGGGYYRGGQNNNQGAPRNPQNGPRQNYQPRSNQDIHQHQPTQVA